jgi:hypothetical protein
MRQRMVLWIGLGVLVAAWWFVRDVDLVALFKRLHGVAG